MTFSVSGYCKNTGMVGVAITTSSICVASRCPWVRAGVGAAATQNITNPGLGNLMLDQLEKGFSVEDSINKIVKENNHIEFRQLSLIDTKGNSASYTGLNTLGTNAVAKGENCIAAGNLLNNKDVAQTMVNHFNMYKNLSLPERLLSALQSGVDIGGEVGPVHSAGIKVAHKYSWPIVDLRIDWADKDPTIQLMDLWKSYEPQMIDYNARAIDPTKAPSYGVPGDE